MSSNGTLSIHIIACKKDDRSTVQYTISLTGVEGGVDRSWLGLSALLAQYLRGRGGGGNHMLSKPSLQIFFIFFISFSCLFSKIRFGPSHLVSEKDVIDGERLEYGLLVVFDEKWLFRCNSCWPSLPHIQELLVVQCTIHMQYRTCSCSWNVQKKWCAHLSLNHIVLNPKSEERYFWNSLN